MKTVRSRRMSLFSERRALLWLVSVFWAFVSVGCGGRSGTHTPSLVSLQIQAPVSTVLLGRSAQLTALGKFDDGSSRDVTASVTWNSGSPLVALVGDNNGRKGFFTGIGGGSSTISAVSGAITATSNVAVTVPTPRFAYLLTYFPPAGPHTIISYTVDPNTGSFSPLPGPPLPVAGSIGVSPDGNFLFALCSPTVSGPEAICSFAIDRNTGALQTASTTPPLGQPAASIAISPSGRFLYTTDATLASCPIAGFSIDVGKGVLTQLPNSPVASRCGEIAIDPAERFLYSAGGGDGVIVGFDIDQKTGTLTSMSGSPFQAPLAVFTSFNDMTMDVAGRSVYYDFAWTVSNLALNGVTGALAFLSGAPMGTKFPCQITPTGRFFYAPDCMFGSISQFSIDPGTAKIAEDNTFSTQGIIGRLTIDPSGKFLYAVNAQLQIEIYSIDGNTGALNLLSTMPTGLPQGNIAQLLVIG